MTFNCHKLSIIAAIKHEITRGVTVQCHRMMVKYDDN